MLTIDGQTGAVYLGQGKVAVERLDAELAENRPGAALGLDQTKHPGPGLLTGCPFFGGC